MNNEPTIYNWVGWGKRLSEVRRMRRLVELVREGMQGDKGRFGVGCGRGISRLTSYEKAGAKKQQVLNMSGLSLVTRTDG